MRTQANAESYDDHDETCAKEYPTRQWMLHDGCAEYGKDEHRVNTVPPPATRRVESFEKFCDLGPGSNGSRSLGLTALFGPGRGRGLLLRGLRCVSAHFSSSRAQQSNAPHHPRAAERCSAARANMLLWLQRDCLHGDEMPLGPPITLNR